MVRLIALVTYVVDPILRSGRHVVDRVERNYGDAEDGPFMIAGSTGCIELSVANGSAADLLQLGRGERVSIFPRPSRSE